MGKMQSNLRREHFLQLTKPIITNEAEMVLGQPTDTLINYHINPFKPFTGQRAILRLDKGLKHPTKFNKTNQSRAVREYMFEGIQIALIVFININLITKIITNRINNL